MLLMMTQLTQKSMYSSIGFSARRRKSFPGASACSGIRRGNATQTWVELCYAALQTQKGISTAAHAYFYSINDRRYFFKVCRAGFGRNLCKYFI